MNSQDAEKLISEYLFDRAGMTPEEISCLSEWIAQDPSHVKHYRTCIRLNSTIHKYYGRNDRTRMAAIRRGSPELHPAMTYEALVTLLRMEANSPGLKVEKPQPDQERRPRNTVPRQTGSRFWLSVAMTSLAAVLLVVIWVTIIAPPPVAVATLRDSLDAQWVDTGTTYSEGHRFTNDGQPIRLAKGLARFSFDRGAEVVLEGPSEVRVCGVNRMVLSHGRVCARVPPTAKGFRVDAPHYAVVDLGTEFGMEVGADGTANVLMYRGKASFVSARVSRPEAGVLITEGQAQQVTMDGHIEDADIEPNRFVRAFDRRSGLQWRGEPIDLANVVGGGNGFGGAQVQYGVSLSSGLIAPMTLGSSRLGPGGYVQVKGSSFIDGVFVPGRNTSSTQISSGGNVWNGCPKTSGTVLTGPCDGGYVGVPETLMVLKGVRYGTPSHPAVLLHSNAGITFDLRSMRRFCQKMSGSLAPSHLQAIAGLSDDVRTQWAGQLAAPPVADFWILVDGQERRKVQLTARADPVHVDIPLQADAEFLTLAVTEGMDRTPALDWVIFGDPIIVLSCD